MTMVVEVPEDTRRVWSLAYLALWIAWAVFAVVVAVIGRPENRDLWWALAGTFAVLEAIGGLARADRRPMLTEVFGRYVPGFVLFPVLALAMWRLSHWVPGWILWPAAAWQIQHFVWTYHSWQKMGGDH
jgi:hypothetical protein